MRREAAKLLWDAREAADRLHRFVGQHSLDSYLGDEVVRSAVERQLEVMGEALGRLRALEPDVARRVPRLQQLVAFRNFLLHQYGDSDSRLVWDVVKTRLPALREALRTLLPEA
jgi:uncharacterized protein with HEPN domain